MTFRQNITILIRLICSICIPDKEKRRKIINSILIFLKITDYSVNRKKYNIGEFSYIGQGTQIYNRAETKIGKYCSISHEVMIGLSQHPLDTLTTHGFIGCKDGDCIAINNLLTVPEKNRVEFGDRLMPACNIGNDVWIGYRAMIMDGVSIGDGAVVGAGAVVTKNVEPYTIVCGVPAKPIRKRFSEGVIERLLELKWWDYPPEFVEKLPFADVEKCIELLEQNIELRDKSIKNKRDIK